MAQSNHTPAADASEAEWKSFLKGRGYVKTTQEKPISNYKELHGFWVPPRLGSPSKAAATPARRSTKRLAGAPERAWYSVATLSKLYWQDRRTFDALIERIAEVKAGAVDQENLRRIEEHRQLLEPAVEAGLLNQAEADKKLAAWAKSEKLTLPK